jgi:SOS response regulatory protein OraA/RecX
MNRPQSTAEMRAKLLRLCNRWQKKAPDLPPCDEMVASVVRRLEELDMLNDERFASWLAQQRVTFRPKPRAVMAAELQFRHKIDREDAVAALDTAGADDLTACRREARKISKRRSGQKLLESLLRKGYSFKVVQIIVKELEDQQHSVATTDSDDRA